MLKTYQEIVDDIEDIAIGLDDPERKFETNAIRLLHKLVYGKTSGIYFTEELYNPHSEDVVSSGIAYLSGDRVRLLDAMIYFENEIITLLEFNDIKKLRIGEDVDSKAYLLWLANCNLYAIRIQQQTGK